MRLLKTTNLSKTALALILIPTMGMPLLAQDEQATDEIFELSPFEVNTARDVGYLSTNSTAGTSLNTQLKDLPMSVQVINQEFISDLGATNLEESLEYSSGVFTSDNQTSSSVGSTRGGGSGDRSISSAAGGDRFANEVYIRGLSVPFQNRMGFRYGGVVVTENTSIALGGLMDSSNIERMEVVKGPNSLLYGVGVLTGIVNVLPEKPLSEPFYEFSFRVGSENFRRATMDLTGPLKGFLLPGELNYRIAGSLESRDHWTDFRSEEVEYYAIQLEHIYKDKSKLFLEFQSGDTRHEGIGSQWIYDEVNSSQDTEFRNEYDEAFNWVRHSGTVDRLRPLDPDGFQNDYETNVGDQPGFRLLDEPFEGGDKPRDYRITGPDTFAERDEWNFIADLILTPIEGLALKSGAFFSQQETEELNISFDSLSIGDPNNFVQNTTQRDRQLGDIFENGGVYGVPMQHSVEERFGLNYSVDSTAHPGDYVFPSLNDDVKLTEYYWERSLVKSDSAQYRFQATYDFETPFLFDTTANHTFLAGYHYIQDDIDFPDGNADRRNARANPPGSVSDEEKLELFSTDALHYRSINNFEPIFLDGRNDNVDGHNAVREGDVYMNQEITQEGKYGVYHGKFWEDRFEIILGVREDSYNADEFVYKRVDMDDETLIQNALSWIETEDVNPAVQKRFGLNSSDPEDFTEEALQFREELLARQTNDNRHIPAYYEDQVEGASAGYWGAGRNRAVDENFGVVPGSSRSVFEKDVKITTNTFAANFDITDNLTVYGVYSEGVTPNTALRDGQGDIIPAETTKNKEIGFKFDFFEGKVSGSMAYFEIDRENAIWDIGLAPAAKKWSDALLEPNRGDISLPSYFPDSNAHYYVKDNYFIDYISDIYGVDKEALDFDRIGNTIQQSIDEDSIPDDPDLGDRENKIRKKQIAQEVRDQTTFPSEMVSGSDTAQQFGGNVTVTTFGLKDEGLDDMHEVTIYDPETGEFTKKNISSVPILYNAFMNRELDKEKSPMLDNFHPVRYRRFNSDGSPQKNNNVDFNQARGSLVTFDETINGVELDLVLTPTENLQFILNYSHIEREADNTFNFTDWRSISTGEHPYVPPFTMLHREYGWENAGLKPVWVDYDEYAQLASGDEPVSSEDLNFEEATENPDEEQISMEEFASRMEQGQQLVFVNREGMIINESNSAKASSYENVLDGVSLNFNPEDEAAFWSKYTFTEGLLDNLSINLGLKYVGSSATSVAFNSVSPLNELTVTPKVASYYKLDGALSYRWQWNRYDLKLAFNVYNILNHRYDITTTTLGIPNPITGEDVTKRTESFYAPRSYRLSLTLSF